jgi:hypothetical protein
LAESKHRVVDWIFSRLAVDGTAAVLLAAAQPRLGSEGVEINASPSNNRSVARKQDERDSRDSVSTDALSDVSVAAALLFAWHTRPSSTGSEVETRRVRLRQRC